MATRPDPFLILPGHGARTRDLTQCEPASARTTISNTLTMAPAIYQVGGQSAGRLTSPPGPVGRGPGCLSRGLSSAHGVVGLVTQPPP